MFARTFACLLLLIVASPGVAQEKPAAPEPNVVVLTLSPAPEPQPALKYKLLPPYLQRLEGNAAPLYLKAVIILRERNVGLDEKVWDNISAWRETEVEKLPREEVRKALALFSAALDETRFAARHERCEWSMSERNRSNIFATLLPEAQATRDLGRLLAVEARLRVADKDFTGAIESLQTGYTLARHVAEQPFLVSSLVGLAISSQLDDQLQALIAAEGSPNVYWALAALPDPRIDLRPALDLEGNSIFLMFPDLRDVRERKQTAEQWRSEFASKARTTAELMMLIEPEKGKGFAGMAKELARAAAIEAMLELRYPTAKKELLAWGYDAKRVDAMAKGQAVLVHEVEYFERTRDDLFKWFELPYWQAYDGLEQVSATFSERVSKRSELIPPPLADMVMPAMVTVYNAEARSQRRVASLQAIEALRMFAAAHEGRWPMSLTDADVLPLPPNPFTGKLPDYVVADDLATLTFAGRGKEAALVYKLRIAK